MISRLLESSYLINERTAIRIFLLRAISVLISDLYLYSTFYYFCGIFDRTTFEGLFAYFTCPNFSSYSLNGLMKGLIAIEAFFSSGITGLLSSLFKLGK